MFLQANNCADCGKNIAGERRSWRQTNLFCVECGDTKEAPLRNKIVWTAVFVLLIGVFAGQIPALLRPAKVIQSPQTLIVSTPKEANAKPPATAKNSDEAAAQSLNSSVQTNSPTPPPSKQLVKPAFITEPTETVSNAYYCGAKTQKGSPCLRRVKNAGRCWQHVGKPAMMPQSKLVIPAQN